MYDLPSLADGDAKVKCGKQGSKNGIHTRKNLENINVDVIRSFAMLRMTH